MGSRPTGPRGGVNTPGVMMTTSRMMGIFRSDERSRSEVLALMGY
jgi:GTP cyclohydrolase I